MDKTLIQREQVNEKYKHISLEMETSTHFPFLIRAVQKTKGTVIELGSGIYSTPLLHWLCFPERKLISYESYPHYLDFARKFSSKNHSIVYVKDWSQQTFDEKISVVLIDHSINRRTHTRGDDAIRFKDAEYVILHDAGKNSDPKYGYENAYKDFKYRKDWEGCYPSTTVLSNVHDLKEFQV